MNLTRSNIGKQIHNQSPLLVFNNTGQGWWNEAETASPLRDMDAGSGSKEATVVAFSCKDHGADAAEVAPTLRAMPHDGSHANAGRQLAVAFHENQRAEVTLSDTAGSLKVGGGKPGQGYPTVAAGMVVRRLTPLECERLMGQPDNATLIEYRGKPAADGPRYKALGNSKVVDVVLWIGERLAFVRSSSTTRKATP